MPDKASRSPRKRVRSQTSATSLMFSLVFFTIYAARLMQLCPAQCALHGSLCRHSSAASFELNDKGETWPFMSGADTMSRQAVLFVPSLNVRAPHPGLWRCLRIYDKCWLTRTVSRSQHRRVASPRFPCLTILFLASSSASPSTSTSGLFEQRKSALWPTQIVSACFFFCVLFFCVLRDRFRDLTGRKWHDPIGRSRNRVVSVRAVAV